MRSVSLLALLLVVLAAGCGQDPVPTAPEGPTVTDVDALLASLPDRDGASRNVNAGYPFPDTPARAIDGFGTAYAALDLPSLARMLHPAFRFVLAPATVEEFGLPRDHLSFDQEIRLLARLFGGLPGLNDWVVEDLDVSLVQMAAWEPVGDTDPYFAGIPGALFSHHEVTIDVSLAEPGLVPHVEGMVRTFVAPSPDNPAAYQVLGFRDFTVRTEDLAWGALQAQFHDFRGYPLAETSDSLVEILVATHEARDLMGYLDLLHPQYRFVVQDQTVEEFGLPDNLFELAEEQLIAWRLFREQPGSNGLVIAEIAFDHVQPQGVWQPVAPDDPDFGDVPGTLQRTYDVRFRLLIQGQYLQFIVDGLVIVYAAPVEIQQGGTTTTIYQLLGQRDFTGSAKTESMSWSRLKAFYQ